MDRTQGKVATVFHWNGSFSEVTQSNSVTISQYTENSNSIAVAKAEEKTHGVGTSQATTKEYSAEVEIGPLTAAHSYAVSEETTTEITDSILSSTELGSSSTEGSSEEMTYDETLSQSFT